MRIRVVIAACVTAGVLACGELLSGAPAPDEGDASPPDAGSESTTPLEDGGGDPYEVVASGVNVTTLAASANALAWVSGGKLHTILDGGPLTVEIMSTNINVLDTTLALDDRRAYYLDGSGVRGCDLGPSCAPGAPMFGLDGAITLALSLPDVFAGESVGRRRIVRCGALGNCGMSPEIVAILPAGARFLTVATTRVVAGLVDQTIVGADKNAIDGGAPALLATTKLLTGIFADGNTIYFTDANANARAGTGALYRCDAVTCTPEALASDLANPRNPVVFGATLYWLEADANAVMKCALPGCTDRTPLATIGKPRALAVADRVYVYGSLDAKIYALPR